MARKHRIQVVLEVFRPIPVDLDHFRDFDFSTFRTRLSQHFFSKIEPDNLESGTRKSESGTWGVRFRDLEQSVLDRFFSMCSQGIRKSELGIRKSELDVRDFELSKNDSETS